MYDVGDDQLNRVEDSFVAYLSSSAGMVAANDGTLSKFSIKQFFGDRLSVVSAIRAGIPYSLFDVIAAFTPFSEEDWAGLLGISTKSLQRYKKEDNFRFKSIHSEKIIEMTEVTALGLDVFDTSEQFYLWLTSPSYALGGHSPKHLLNDSYGKELVMDELYRIDHGVFA